MHCPALPRQFIAAAAFCLLLPCLRAETVLHRWDFSTGIGTWVDTNSVAPLSTQDDALVVRVTGFDPYIHSSDALDINLAGNADQVIRLTARSSITGTAEFFWAADKEGRDAGFVGGDEIPFRLRAGDQFHTYTVFPGWDGDIRRLRFDPPGGETEGAVVEIRSIEIIQLPPSRPNPGPRWDFAAGLDGFRAQHFIENVTTTNGTTAVTGFGPAPTLVAESLRVRAQTTPWLTLNASVDRPSILQLMWVNEDEQHPSCRTAIRLRPGTDRYVVHLTDRPNWFGTIVTLKLIWQAADDPVTLGLKSLVLDALPQGPPRAEITHIGFDRAVAWIGEEVRVRATIRNTGGRPLSSLPLRLQDRNGTAGQTLHVPRIAPGETAEVVTGLRVSRPGPVDLVAGLGGVRYPRPLRLVVCPPLPTEAPAGPVALTVSQVVLSHGDARLRAPRQQDGTYGPIHLESRGADGLWQCVGTMPAVGAVHLPDTEPTELVSGTVHISGLLRKAVSFTRTIDAADGSRWVATATFSPGRTDGILRSEHTLRAVTGGALLRYDGPVLRTGDRAFGADKYEALFPGVEYLGSDELSSSDRDIQAPGDLRLTTHPHRICIPLMAVASPQRVLVALLWHNQQRWHGREDRPAALFASPNFAESGDSRVVKTSAAPLRSGDNHLMGLFVPSVPDHVDENGLAAREPLLMQRRDMLRLTARLLIRPDSDVLDAVTTWLDLYPPVDVGRMPENRQYHYNLSLRAMEEILYTEGEGWAGVQGWDPTPNPGTALLYLYLAHELGRPEVRAEAKRRIGTLPALPLGLHLGHVHTSVKQAQQAGYQHIGQRGSDNQWGFRPAPKSLGLGVPGDTNIGMAAGSVNGTLRAAAQTGDKRLLRHGLEGLEWMRQWRVPRGSQVWEIPLHAPDILASAHACSAYLRGYRLTGNPSYRDDAIYWARTGLPFVYFWQTPEAGLEPMRGGTIPIFGATFYAHSWYGRLVQWCGLEYASAIQDLAAFDDSHDWRTIARDIVVSGWRQQQAKDGFQGLYPDSWCMLTGAISWGLMLGPQRLIHNQLKLDGLAPEGDSRHLRRGEDLIALLAPGTLRDAEAAGQPVGKVVTELPDGVFDLAFEHTFEPHPWAYVAVVGVREPLRVWVRGELAPRRPRADGAGSCWTWADNILVIRSYQKGRRATSIRIEELDIATPPPLTTRWDFDGDAGGWVADNDLEALTISNGALRATPTGSDPYLTTALVDLNAATYPRVEIRYRHASGGPMEIYWAGSQGGFSPDRRIGTTLPPAPDWATATIELRQHPQWRGVVFAFRIDPPPTGLEIDRIAFVGE